MKTRSTEEKLSILREGSENGVHPILQKHGDLPRQYRLQFQNHKELQ